ncbi:ubiquinol cytochrome C oxidoreductase, cytochrome C1 subunit [invertebrate metagenome]|uniref:Ubiquinol cytochrome C oxidoreductase, cytochrome C1 subunit n=1 Tax=invertebrate metagenome TaxID=1711999 RepID=A0A484H684_9ZZZZ
MRRFFVFVLVATWLAVPAVASSEEKPLLAAQSWPWRGIFGSYDKDQLRRGFMVYSEVCANCHGLRLVAYRNLVDIGFTDEEIKTIAAEKEVQDGPNEQGEMFTRFARPSDRFVSPYANDQAARVANNGALPPDLSLMAKARAGGPDYLYSLLTGYEDPPSDVILTPGMNYNKAFPGQQIAMPQPLFEDMVTYDDGTSASLPQLAKDVTAFLNWTAEPELDARHALGLKTLAFLVFLTGLFYALKRQIWSGVH